MEDILNAVGGMSKRTKRALIGIGSALGAAALFGMGVFAINKFGKDNDRKKYEDKHLKNVAEALPSKFKNDLVSYLASINSGRHKL